VTDETLKEFLVASERNMRIAEAVCLAWPGARCAVIDGFLNRLGKRLCATLGGWKFEVDNNFYKDAYANLAIFKPTWTQYWVGLNSAGQGEKIDIGVVRDEDTLKDVAFRGEVLAAVQTLHPSARAKKWREAAVTMRSPAGDWRSSDVVWRIHADEAFFEEVTGLLLDVARAVEPVLDGLAKKGT
jgi:hypothetical protein